MSYLREVDLGEFFHPFSLFREYYGYVPKLWRAQTLLPPVVEALAELANATIFPQRTIPRILKERTLLAIAQAHRNAYCAAAAYQILTLLGVEEAGASLSGEDALLEFAVKLAVDGPCISRPDVAALSTLGWSDESILEAVLIAGWGNLICTLAAGVGAECDFPPPRLGGPKDGSDLVSVEESWGPYLHATPMPNDFGPFVFWRDNLGFVPNVFKAQTLCGEAVAAQAEVMRSILYTDDVLKRIQKERVLLAVSGANQNTYCVAVHAEILGLLGFSTNDAYQIASGHIQCELPDPDRALLDFAVKLATRPTAFSSDDVQWLTSHGFSEEQILEAIAVTAWTQYLNTVQQGTGAAPDFAPRRSFRAIGRRGDKKENLSSSDSRLTTAQEHADPDADLVSAAQAGDLQAFETLVERHSKRIYRTLIGILGHPEEARDAMQDTFLKVFQHLASFQGRSKFSTWLVTIASNTGLQRIRERRPIESLDDTGPEGDEGFRPRQVRAWTDDPEALYSQSEVRSLVEQCVMKLPANYRVVVLLRDFEQLSAEDAAAALGIGVPALKSRLLRGRLMLREALAPYFAKNPKGVSV